MLPPENSTVVAETAIVASTVTYDPATRGATLNPSANLRPGTAYIATVTPGTKDLAGNALDQDPNATGNQAKSWKVTVSQL